jgi:DNA-binding NarL/FixJ family response regulator
VLNEMREYKVRLPTVVLTAHVLSHYVKASLEAQVLAVVSKPVTLATLRCILNEHARVPPQPSKLVEA